MNLKALAEKIGLEEDEYRELAELFLETGRVDFEQMETALDAADADEVSRRAHTLRGASGNLGIMAVHEVAKRIEMAAIDNRLDDAAADAKALKGLLDKVALAVGR
ncbi:MAG: Hpt domain-containing protein [Desulfosarcina sp.]|jgi:HPt (histidine-containing phosphotransfer) domain-containing protein